MKKLNVGLLGIGGMGLLHLANCLHMREIEVVSVADKSKSLLNRAEKYGVKKRYDDYKVLLDEEKDKLDAVVISLPNFLHRDSIIKSLECDLDVFIEKPLAISVSQCQDIMKFEESSGRRIMVGYNMRFVDAIQKMKLMSSEGRIGDLEYLTLELILNGPLGHGRVPKPISEWWLNPELSGGGALIDLGTHMIDLFHHFTGEADVIFSKLDYKFKLPVEDGATVILESKNRDTRGIINAGWFEKTIFPKYNFRAILHGSADYISSEDLTPHSLYVHAVKEGIKNFFKRITGRRISPLSYTYWYSSYYEEIRHFVNSILKDEDMVSTSYEGYKNIETISNAYDLYKKGEGYE